MPLAGRRTRFAFDPVGVLIAHVLAGVVFHQRQLRPADGAVEPAKGEWRRKLRRLKRACPVVMKTV
jgi:hypothetical protein